MVYAKLGNTGMDVSRICLGCMGFGDAQRWVHKWVLNEENSRPVIKKALDMGINFFDTANVYSIGKSEEILGRALKDFATRDEVVIGTKLHGKMREGPNGGGLSRKAILSEIDSSLRRLGTDYVDLYQIHRWDYETPIEETGLPFLSKNIFVNFLPNQAESEGLLFPLAFQTLQSLSIFA